MCILLRSLPAFQDPTSEYACGEKERGKKKVANKTNEILLSTQTEEQNVPLRFPAQGEA